ncbi:MAG: hypothetical protein LIO95_04950 [Clostridiales bacterium]|nr:hypothetical protein [Clostridiales bacterium]
MAVTKIIEIDGQEVRLKASAAIPRIYRMKFGRDILQDMNGLSTVTQESDADASSLDPEVLTMFENVAYTFAKHADPKGVPDSPDEWLEEFGTFSIYTALPEILDLWADNLRTEVERKKNLTAAAGK